MSSSLSLETFSLILCISMGSPPPHTHTHTQICGIFAYIPQTFMDIYTYVYVCISNMCVYAYIQTQSYITRVCVSFIPYIHAHMCLQHTILSTWFYYCTVVNTCVSLCTCVCVCLCLCACTCVCVWVFLTSYKWLYL